MEYPTDKELESITDLAGRLGEKGIALKFKLKELIETIEGLWAYADCGYFEYEEKDGKWSLQLSTAGWSGNESIIGALKPYPLGTLFWVLYWQKSERGGHYYFKGNIQEVSHG
jgi:hypothetical protein